MLKEEIDWRSGRVEQWDLSEIDSNIPLSHQTDSLKEDMAQVLYGSHVVLDVGWYPSGSPDGAFRVVVVNEHLWSAPMFKRRCATMLELRVCLELAVERAELSAFAERGAGP